MSNTPRTRKATAKATVGVAGTTGVDFDLDAIEIEANDKPFSFRHGGESFTMASPQNVDWQTAVAAENGDLGALQDMLRALLGDEGYERFTAIPLKAGKLRPLMTACAEHYGARPGESPAS